MRGERRTAYWMAAPALIAVLAIIVYPLAFATYYSLREVRGNLVGEFVGLANYAGIARDARSDRGQLRANRHLRPDESLPPEGVRGTTSLACPLRRA